MDTYLWIRYVPSVMTITYGYVPEVSDNVVPGLDNNLIYNQSKYANINIIKQCDNKYK